MAISFRGSASFAAPYSVSQITLDKPTGTANNDFLIAIVQASQSRTFTNPSGWTTIVGWDASTGVRLRAAWKAAGSSEPSQYQWSIGGSENTCSGVIMSFVGVDLADPIRDFETLGEAFANFLSSPTLVGTQATDMVVIAAGARPESGSSGANTVTPATWNGRDSGPSASGGWWGGGGFPGSSSMGWKTNGTTGNFTIDTGAACGFGTFAVSLKNDGTPPAATTHEATGTSTSLSSGSGELAFPPRAEYADYEFFIDWNRDNGLRVSDFETAFDGWGPTTLLSLSSDNAYAGTKSLRAAWQNQTPSVNPSNSFEFNDVANGFDTGVFAYTSADPADDAVLKITYVFNGLKVGLLYTLSAWVFVPVSGGQHVTLGITNLATSTATSTTNQWVKVEVPFVAQDTQHELFVKANGAVVNNNATYIDYVFVIGEFEDISNQVRREGVGWTYGRDQSRALSPVTPSETSIVVDNQDGRYSPNNGGSPIADVLFPNRELLIRAVWRDNTYDLYRGYTDDIEVHHHLTEQSVTFTAIDPLGSVGSNEISTEVFHGQRTGDAIHKVLDAVGWPANRRDIDPGGTVIPHFWVEGQDASDAIKGIIDSEGPPSYVAVNSAGYFTFKDRHHRIVNARSTASQAVWRALGEGQEPLFSLPSDINLGWKDIINSVTVSVKQPSTIVLTNDERSNGSTEEGSESERIEGTGEAPAVWKNEGTFSIPGGTSLDFKVDSEIPVLFFQIPSAIKNDYVIAGGSVQFSLSRTSGMSTVLTVTAPDNDVSITGLAVRGYAITYSDGIVIQVDDEVSQEEVGQKADPTTIDAPWATVHDALAIGQVIVNQRGKRLPTMTVSFNNGSTERMNQILKRRMSDRVTIIEPLSFTNQDFYIESISHEISEAGKYHEVTFGCEMIPPVVVAEADPITLFTFDSATEGFDAGAFGTDTIQSDPDDILILDVSKLDEDGLGL